MDRLPGSIHDVRMDHIRLTSEGPIVIAGEEYSEIRDVTIRDANIVYKKQSSMYPDMIDEMPSARGRYKHEIPCIYIRKGQNVTVDGKFTVDDSLKEYIKKREIRE